MESHNVGLVENSEREKRNLNDHCSGFEIQILHIYMLQSRLVPFNIIIHQYVSLQWAAPSGQLITFICI